MTTANEKNVFNLDDFTRFYLSRYSIHILGKGTDSFFIIIFFFWRKQI